MPPPPRLFLLSKASPQTVASARTWTEEAGSQVLHRSSTSVLKVEKETAETTVGVTQYLKILHPAHISK